MKKTRQVVDLFPYQNQIFTPVIRVKADTGNSLTSVALRHKAVIEKRCSAYRSMSGTIVAGWLVTGLAGADWAF